MSEVDNNFVKQGLTSDTGATWANAAPVFQKLLKEQLGIAPDPAASSALLKKRVQFTNKLSVDQYLAELKNDPHHTEWQVLATEISIPETYFFRDPNQWRAFSQFAVPRSLGVSQKENRKLKIWCAASATGEEPYTITMALSEKLKLAEKGLDAEVIASDLVESYLEVARAGIYRSNSFRDDYDDYKARFFRKISDGRFEIQKNKLPNIDFQPLNLAEQSAVDHFINNHGPFDIIFCRNVLIYFTADVCRRLLEQFAKALTPKGLLFLGPAEFPALWTDSLKSIATNGTFLWSAHEHEDILAERSLSRTVDPPLPKAETNNLVASVPTEQASVISCKKNPAHKSAVETTGLSKNNPIAAPQLVNRTILNSIKLLLENMQSNDISECLSTARMLVETNDLVAEAHYALGTVLEHHGEPKNAITAYSHAVFLENTFALAHWRLAMLLAVEGNKQRAAAELHWAMDSLEHESDERLLLLGQTDRTTLLHVMEQTVEWLKN